MRRLPQSLSVRLFLIVLAGVVLAIGLTNALHHHDRARVFGEFRERAALAQLADVARLLSALIPAARQAAAAALPPGEWLVEFDPPTPPSVGESAWSFSETLNERLGDAAQVEEAWVCAENKIRCPYSALAKLRFNEGQTVWIGHRPLTQVRPLRNQGQELQTRIAVFAAVMALVAWIVVRIALRPLRRLAQAVDDFGRDMTHPPMDESGPSEVRRAAQAFNAMQQRIRGHMAERTQILASVTHDLKTPLTRMRLRLEKCADAALKDRLLADLGFMQTLVEEGLELARSLDASEPAQLVALDALLQSHCDDAADAGWDVVYAGPDDGVLVMVRASALGRVFANLIDNAVKYGQYARVSLEQRDGMAQVCIVDGGPGIPEESLQEVLKPFVRLEASRSRDTGGTGLGLAIAANLLRCEQGLLSLSNRPEGGLEARVELRLAPAAKRN
jgi:signal transduction histidine kinase